MKNKVYILVILGTLALLLWPNLSEAQNVVQPTPCQSFVTNRGYFFDDYEQAEYQNGFLVLHLKLKPEYSDGRTWLGSMILYRGDCRPEILVDPSKGTSAPRGLQFFSVRFTSLTHYELWNDELDVKIDCPACAMDLPTEMSDGAPYVSVGYSADIDSGGSNVNTASYPIAESGPVFKNPVIIVPGLLGTELKTQDGTVWPNLEKIVLDPSDGFLDTLAMRSTGESLNPVFSGNVISSIAYPFGSFHYTDLLVKDLEDKGYQLDKNLFLFSYDWRLDLRDIGGGLENEINMALEQSGGEKVEIIGHSYGGLVLKYLLANNPKIDAKIETAIFAGMPNLGSAEAAQALVFGSNLGIPLLNPSEIKILAANMPSIFDLLPSKKYFEKIAGWFDDLSDPALPGILDYGQSKQLLTDLGKNLALIEQAESFHNTMFDNYDFSSKPYKTVNINSCGLFTTKTISKLYNGQPLLNRILHVPKYQISGDSGDGTVLLKSAQTVAGPINITYAGIKHNQLLSDGKSINDIVKILTEAYSPPETNEDCSVNGKLLALPSGIEVNIGNLQLASSSALNLEDASDLAGDTFLFLPDGPDYQLELVPGYFGQGEFFSFSIANYSGSDVSTEVYNEIPIEPETTYMYQTDSGHGEFSLRDSEGQIEIMHPEKQGVIPDYHLVAEDPVPTPTPEPTPQAVPTSTPTPTPTSAPTPTPTPVNPLPSVSLPLSGSSGGLVYYIPPPANTSTPTPSPSSYPISLQMPVTSSLSPEQPQVLGAFQKGPAVTETKTKPAAAPVEVSEGQPSRTEIIAASPKSHSFFGILLKFLFKIFKLSTRLIFF